MSALPLTARRGDSLPISELMHMLDEPDSKSRELMVQALCHLLEEVCVYVCERVRVVPESRGRELMGDALCHRLQMCFRLCACVRVFVLFLRSSVCACIFCLRACVYVCICHHTCVRASSGSYVCTRRYAFERVYVHLRAWGVHPVLHNLCVPVRVCLSTKRRHCFKFRPFVCVSRSKTTRCWTSC